jgi:hypothetical protein
VAWYGLGQDIWTVAVPDIEQMLKLFYVTEPLYLAATILTKIAICLFLLRIFPVRRFQITMWIIVGICVVVFIAFALAVSGYLYAESPKPNPDGFISSSCNVIPLSTLGCSSSRKWMANA